MLSLISLGRSAWAKLQAAHPVIRWGGAILIGLVALEFIAQEAISLYVQMQTASATIARQRADAIKAKVEECKARANPQALNGPAESPLVKQFHEDCDSVFQISSSVQSNGPVAQQGPPRSAPLRHCVNDTDDHEDLDNCDDKLPTLRAAYKRMNDEAVRQGRPLFANGNSDEYAKQACIKKWGPSECHD